MKCLMLKFGPIDLNGHEGRKLNNQRLPNWFVSVQPLYSLLMGGLPEQGHFRHANLLSQNQVSQKTSDRCITLRHTVMVSEAVNICC